MIGTQPFGRTGHMSTRVIFGAAALGKVTQAEADRTLDLLLEYGINHIDTAASYGESELRIGPWMARHRDQFFLATKTQLRTYREAREQIHQSLEKLRTDRIDLIQLHYLVGAEEWQVAMGPGGALEAAVEAREQGLVRHIGVTGHDVAIAGRHKQSLDRFDFDSLLFPYSYILMQHPEYAAGVETLFEMAKARNVAVQTIKSITRRPYGEGERSHATWYAPLTEQEDIDKAVWWVLGREGIFLNTVGDITLLPKVLDAASRYEARPSDAEMAGLLEKAEMAPLFV
jgi:aryl-alcohol dehydrogenase-like predicted oxidoreductase